MTFERSAILTEAKAKVRTLNSAPDPHARARAIYSDLVRVEGWSTAQ